MLFGNMLVDAFAALGLMVVLVTGGVAFAACKLARSDAGKALLDGLKKPRKQDTRPD